MFENVLDLNEHTQMVVIHFTINGFEYFRDIS